jgi:hypothetical protein
MLKTKLTISKTISLAILLCFYFSIKAQESFKLKGRILSKTEDPISFAHIVSTSNLKKGAVAGHDGSFEIETYLGDTLLISHLGYESIKMLIANKKNLVLNIEFSNTNLTEFVVKPHIEEKEISAKEIIKKVIYQWDDNYIVFKNNYLVNLNVDFSIKEDNKYIYTYKGNINLSLIKGAIYSNKLDVNKKKQKKHLHDEVLKLTGGNPYNIIQQLGFSLSNNNDFSYTFGNITQYKNTDVYHINFHKKEGHKLCESGGFYLISKNNFVVLYLESNSKNCTIFQDESVNVGWDYFSIKYSFAKNKYSKYSISKIESTSQYTITQRSKNTTFYQIENYNVKSIEKKKKRYFKTNELTPSKTIFYSDE